MSKNTKNNVVATPVATVVEKQNLLAAAQAELVRLQEEIKVAQETERLELLARVNALPAQFGLETMDAFLAMINNVTGRKVSKSKVRLTAENKTEITNLLTAGTLSAKQIASQFNVSTGTINQLKKVAGLTKARVVKTSTKVTQ